MAISIRIIHEIINKKILEIRTIKVNLPQKIVLAQICGPLVSNSVLHSQSIRLKIVRSHWGEIAFNKSSR